MQRKFIRIMMYGSLHKEDYFKTRPILFEDNRKKLIAYSLFGIIFFIFSELFSIFSKSDFLPEKSKIYFITASILLLICILNVSVAKKIPAIIYMSVYLYVLTLLSFGIYIGIVVTPAGKTALYLAMLMTVSSLFYMASIGYVICIFLCNTVYYLLILRVNQPEPLLYSNIANVTTFGIISIVFGCYSKLLTAQRFNSLRLTEYLLKVDAFTEMYNRRYFETTLTYLKQISANVEIIFFNIDNLRFFNKKEGHQAGDEIIRKVAGFLKETFSNYGDCFRIGGDEFVIILKNYSGSTASLLSVFEEKIADFNQKENKSIEVSYAKASSKEFPDDSIYDLAKKAETFLYEKKTER